MIVDTSALVSIIWSEEESEALVDGIVDASAARISAASYLELGIVIDSKHDATTSARIDTLIEELGIEIVPVTAKQARLARAAYARFGKGSGHAARLNFGDCFSYALAMDADEPLLFKGDDFNHTDVVTG